MRTLTDSFGNPIRTLCDICCNAVPNGRDHGCEWSVSFLPVPGWDALFKPVSMGDKKVDSYRVYSCPRYLKEPPRKIIVE